MLRMASAAGKGTIAAAVLGSGVSFLDGTVVNAALPAIADDLETGLSGVQWVVTGYLLALGSLIVLGGSLGDRYGRRRIFVLGLLGFAASSVLCGLAPTEATLIGARLVQGVAAALLVPASLAIISSTFVPEERAAAIGAWSGLGGVATAIGPFLGGWLIDSISWRWVFLINVPLVAVAVVLAWRYVPETRDETAHGRLDWIGASTLTFGLAGVVYALIEGPAGGWPTAAIAAGVVGALLLVAFVVAERTVPDPMVPLWIFRNPQFSGANVVTFAVYAALGGSTFFLVVHLQTDLGYSALAAGAALLPITVCMLLFSTQAGAWSQRIGPRVPMTLGPVVVGAGMALLATVDEGSAYWTGVLPAVTVLAIGLTITVAPLTAAVLGAIDDQHAGLGSAVNNAVARIAGLLAVAVLPAAVGIAGGADGLALGDGYARAMLVCAVLSVIGGGLAWLTIRAAQPVVPLPHADPNRTCIEPPLLAGEPEPGATR